MKIGTINMPGRMVHKGQSIRARFFILGLPLFPTGCIYKITDNLGINVPLTGKDILHAFAKIHIGLLGLALPAIANNMFYNNKTMEILFSVLGLAMIAFSIYSWMKHSTVDKKEAYKRDMFGKAFLYNMPPEHLPKKVQENLFAEMLRTYMAKFAKVDWQSEILNEGITQANLPSLYTLAYYQKTLNPDAKNLELFEKVEAVAHSMDKVDNNQVSSNKVQTKFDLSTKDTANFTSDSGNSSNSTSNTSPAAISQSIAKSVKMEARDVRKVHDAKTSMNNQLYMLCGIIGVILLICAFVIGNLVVILLAAAIFAAIAAFIFIPGYIKINKDLAGRKKIEATVRIGDVVQDSGDVYLIPKHNKYGIKRFKAPPNYASLSLLNKEMKVWVSKESHTLIEVIEVKH